jgi:hypothetical protein
LPLGNSDLTNTFTAQELTDIATINSVYVDQSATSQYAIFQFKNFVGAASALSVEWYGKAR